MRPFANRICSKLTTTRGSVLWASFLAGLLSFPAPL
jgi:hypothetical protein